MLPRAVTRVGLLATFDSPSLGQILHSQLPVALRCVNSDTVLML